MEKRDYEFKDQRIEDVEMGTEVKKSFIDYAMSVIMSRALPDVRDGMKPVHRRVLYAMYEDHLTSDRPFRKSATTVGNVLGRYHPHGDSAVYDTMVRMAQTFSLRYPLIDGHGNFGNVDGDGAAAYRYTEARMAKISDLMLADIEKDVVDFTPNFDNKLKEPVVLPSRFPNLLVNGSVGIAVGMATNIPPHNLCEVIDGTLYLMDNPDATVIDLMKYIKAPDFPTRGLICGTAGVYEAYMTGRGRIVVRARVDVNEDKNTITVSELPYQVNKAMLCQAISECVKDKRIEGITRINDYSDQKNGIRIEIGYRRDANGQVILNQLYKYTQLQDTFAVNMVALVNNEPKVLGLIPILQYYIEHQKEVIVRRIRFDLAKAEREAHINEGYKIAADNIDEVINIIRSSMSIPEAKQALSDRFSLSDVQAQAIVDMTLGRLAGMERQKVIERLEKLYALIEELKSKISSDEAIKEVIKEELLEIKRRFGDERRSEIVPMEEEILVEDLIERHTCVITMSHSGYIKRLPSDTYSAQRRGGKGIIGMATKDEDFVETVLAVDSHSYLLLFTNKGKIHVRKAFQIPEAGRTAKGTNVVNLVELDEGEKVTTIISIQGFEENEYLTMVTKLGVIKRTLMSEYSNRRKGGKIALDLDEGDELVFVKHTKGGSNLIIATHGGNAARFNEDDVRVMGRTARGVRGIKLEDGDYVKGVAVVEEDKSLITVTENGYGKRSSFDDFQCHARGGKGVSCHNVNEKTGMLAGIASVSDSDDLMIITNDGTIIRTPVADIPQYHRSAGGVIVMRPADGSYIISFARVDHEDEKDEDEEVTPETETASTESAPETPENDK